MRRVFFAGVVSCLAIVTAACSAPPGTGEEGDETPGETSEEALKTSVNPGGLGSVCRACGCDWVSRRVDGCTVFRCECSSEAKANCVVNAPGGVARAPGDVVVEPTGPLAPPVATVYAR